MGNLALQQQRPVRVEQTQLMEAAAPVDAGERMPAGGLVTARCMVNSLESPVTAVTAGLVGTSSRRSNALLPLADAKPATAPGERVCVWTSQAARLNRSCPGRCR
jgi:hypothetical protein